MTLLIGACTPEICIEIVLYHFCWSDMKSMMVVFVVYPRLLQRASKRVVYIYLQQFLEHCT